MKASRGPVRERVASVTSQRDQRGSPPAVAVGGSAEAFLGFSEYDTRRFTGPEVVDKTGCPSFLTPEPEAAWQNYLCERGWRGGSLWERDSRESADKPTTLLVGN